jgi:hypothetical protein
LTDKVRQIFDQPERHAGAAGAFDFDDSAIDRRRLLSRHGVGQQNG